MSYDKARASEVFIEGKKELDHAEYEKAISIFTGLIEESEPYIGTDEEAKLTWDCSLNNRGVAKCNEGYTRGNKALFESGLEDYRKVVESYSEERRQGLTANANLIYGERQLNDFKDLKIAEFRFWDL